MGNAASAKSARSEPISTVNQNLPSQPDYSDNNSRQDKRDSVRHNEFTTKSSDPNNGGLLNMRKDMQRKENEKVSESDNKNLRSRSSIEVNGKESQATTTKNENKARNSNQQKYYFPTEDDLVFETFYHNDGRECECMYMNGQRFYLDSWNSKEWQVFPMKWYDNGTLVTNNIIKEEEAIVQSQSKKEEKDKRNSKNKPAIVRIKDDREGWINHPKRGKLPTYIFEEKHNIHCFYDIYSGMWLRLPLSWELLSPTILPLIEKIEAQIPSWTDRYEMLSLLRACNYRYDECISNYLQVEGDELKGMRNAGDAKAVLEKDQQIKELQEKLNKMEKKLAEERKSKDEAKVLATDLQSRISDAEAGMNAANAQLDVLQQSRPKTARPKTPHITTKLDEEDLKALMKKSQNVNKSYIELKMDAKRWIADVGKSLKEVHNMAAKLKMADKSQSKQLEELRDLYQREATQRRILYNKLQELRGNIRVFLRCRKGEDAKVTSIKFLTDQDIDAQTVQGARKKFQFDKVFNPNSTQEQVFEDTLPIITCCVDGYNVCIMAYGQTGSGKTYTMMGPHNNPGVNIRTLMELLKICNEREDTTSYRITISLIEIYNETLQDLLTKDVKQLELRAQGNVITIPGITELDVKNLDDIKNAINMGEENRSVAFTKMNSSSSRSHLVMIVNVTGTDKVTGAQSLGKLMLCDLAGSERISKSEASGQRLVEAAAINKSLAALGQVFSALRGKQLHVPYRNSKLTHILQPALGGDAKACLFVNVNPDVSNLSETVSTLQFGANARQIQLGMAKQNIVQKPDS